MGATAYLTCGCRVERPATTTLASAAARPGDVTVRVIEPCEAHEALSRSFTVWEFIRPDAVVRLDGSERDRLALV